MPDYRIEKHQGFVVIDRTSSTKRVPLACPICSRLLRSVDDAEAIDELDCCFACAMRWAHPDRKRWASGWRPSQEQIKEDLSCRPGIQLPFFDEL